MVTQERVTWKLHSEETSHFAEAESQACCHHRWLQCHFLSVPDCRVSGSFPHFWGPRIYPLPQAVLVCSEIKEFRSEVLPEAGNTTWGAQGPGGEVVLVKGRKTFPERSFSEMVLSTSLEVCDSQAEWSLSCPCTAPEPGRPLTLLSHWQPPQLSVAYSLPISYFL